MAGCGNLQGPDVFLTTSSPDNTYFVALKRAKAAAPRTPIWADVFKNGQLTVSGIWLHTADETFMPFETVYPERRWLKDNVLEFYNRDSFKSGSDSLQVENKTSKPIRYLQVESVNKFLLFDLHPGASVSLTLPAPTLNSQWIAAEGLFSSGEKIRFTSRSFDRRSSPHVSLYKVFVTDSETIIQNDSPTRDGLRP